MKITVLAGGRGTLLWPMSHELRSSQFLRLLGSSESPHSKAYWSPRNGGPQCSCSLRAVYYSREDDAEWHLIEMKLSARRLLISSRSRM
jgi:hypothetical protein